MISVVVVMFRRYAFIASESSAVAVGRQREETVMQGKTIVVTGGFGALGSVVAETAAKRGASVALLDYAPTVPAGFAEQLGANTLIVGGVDLTSLTAAETAMASIKAKFGRLDALLNIAGGFQWDTFADGKVDSWDRMYAMNLKTALNACKAALPYLMESGAGHIVNVGAQSALHAASGIGPLCGQQIGGASDDRKPGRRIEAQGRDGQRRSAIDHRYADEQARHAEGGLQPLGCARRPRRGHAVSGLG